MCWCMCYLVLCMCVWTCCQTCAYVCYICMCVVHFVLIWSYVMVPVVEEAIWCILMIDGAIWCYVIIWCYCVMIWWCGDAIGPYCSVIYELKPYIWIYYLIAGMWVKNKQKMKNKVEESPLPCACTWQRGHVALTFRPGSGLGGPNGHCVVFRHPVKRLATVSEIHDRLWGPPWELAMCGLLCQPRTHNRPSAHGRPTTMYPGAHGRWWPHPWRKVDGEATFLCCVGLETHDRPTACRGMTPGRVKRLER
jgi:hypothetical protein